MATMVLRRTREEKGWDFVARAPWHQVRQIAVLVIRLLWDHSRPVMPKKTRNASVVRTQVLTIFTLQIWRTSVELRVKYCTDSKIGVKVQSRIGLESKSLAFEAGEQAKSHRLYSPPEEAILPITNSRTAHKIASRLLLWPRQ